MNLVRHASRASLLPPPLVSDAWSVPVGRMVKALYHCPYQTLREQTRGTLIAEFLRQLFPEIAWSPVPGTHSALVEGEPPPGGS